MDGLSTAASAIAVLDAALSLSSSLYKFFYSLRTADQELGHYCQIIHGLVSTFARLCDVAKADNPVSLPEELVLRIENCAADLQATLGRLETACPRETDRSVSKHFKRLKWALSSGQWLDKFFQRLQLYFVEFSLNISCIQLQNQASIEQGLTKLHALQSIQMNPDDVEALEEKIESLSKRRMVQNSGTQHSDGQKFVRYHLLRTSCIVKSWTSPQSESCARGTHSHVSLRETTFLQLTLCLRLLAGWRMDLQMALGRHASFVLRSQLTLVRVVPGDAAIIKSAKTGDILKLQGLFQTRKASISDVLTDGTTLLHIAAHRGDVSLTKFLLGQRINPNASDEDLDTALHTAAASHHRSEVLEELAEMLVSAGCDPLAQNKSRKSMFHQMSNRGIRQLIATSDEPIDVYAQDCDGMTVIHYLSYSNSTDPDLVRRLIGNDLASLTVEDCLGRTPVELAIKRGNVALIAFYLGFDQLVRSMTLSGSSNRLLHASVYSKRVGAIELVTRSFPVLEHKDDRGRSILHKAIDMNNTAAVQKIVDLGGAKLLHQPDNAGETPFQLGLYPGAKRELRDVPPMRPDQDLSQTSISKQVVFALHSVKLAGFGLSLEKAIALLCILAWASFALVTRTQDMNLSI